MSAQAEKSDEVRSLKRALIDHMVTTMVAGMMSGFLFMVWHLYSTLEKRVTEQDKESAAAISVLKESAISYKVRIDLLEREMARKPEVQVAQTPQPAPVAAARVETPFWTPAPPRTNNPPAFQQQMQQQQSAPPMIRQSLAEVEAAREELRKKISDVKPSFKP